MSTGDWHLSEVSLEAFGDLFNETLGPFTPGLNLVYGPNESGKTTIAQFIPSVLFGWPEGEGRNSYRPSRSARAGSLSFTDQQGEVVTLRRDADHDHGEGASFLTKDIDRDSYRSLFTFDSDELRHLGVDSEGSAFLLSAGSGATVAPRAVLEGFDESLVAFEDDGGGRTSGDRSLLQLQRELDEAKEEVEAAEAEALRFREQDAEFRALGPRRQELSRRSQRLDEEIEACRLLQSELQHIDQRKERLRESQERRSRELKDLDQAYERSIAERGGELPPIMDKTRERAVRDALSDLQREHDRLESSLHLAQDNQRNSESEYEALVMAPEQQDRASARRRRRMAQVALSLVFPIIALIAGIALWGSGRAIASLSFMALGVVLVVLAFMLGAVAAVTLSRPSRQDEVLDQRIADAHWVTLQDEKKVRSCEEALDQHRQRIESYLAQNELAQAGSSLRRARDLLDAMAEARLDDERHEQAKRSLELMIEEGEEELASLDRQAQSLLRDASLETREEGDRRLEAALEQRRTLAQERESLDTRLGELRQDLAHARESSRFARAKQRQQQLEARLQNAGVEFARLSLARRHLSAAVDRWERQSQPEVYRQASALFATMTKGRWQELRLVGEGRIEVLDAERGARDPDLLSMGTRQQLYLSVRMALLMTADSVGRALPVIADDILVHFDDERRRPTAAALAKLATKRQVILFTGHREVMRLFDDFDGVNRLELN